MHKINRTVNNILDAYKTPILTFYLLEHAIDDPSAGKHK